jgi:hypothetical protein
MVLRKLDVNGFAVAWFHHNSYRPRRFGWPERRTPELDRNISGQVVGYMGIPDQEFDILL